MKAVDVTAEPLAGDRLRLSASSAKVATAFALPAAALILPAAGAGALTGYAFLALAALAAWRLPRLSGPSSLVFLVAVWLTAPLFRRVGDWAAGSFTEQSVALFAPPVVTAISLVSLGRLGLRRSEKDGLWLIGLAAAMGGVVGALRVGPAPAVFGAAEWLVPIGLACLGVTVLRQTDHARRATVDGLAALSLVTSGYGIYQFWFLPPWDEFWLLNAPINSQGVADAGEFRIFATSNSTGVFALSAAFVVLILLSHYRPIYLLPLTVTSVAIALSLVRASWLVVFVGLVVLFFSGRRQKILSLAVGIAAATAVLFSLPSFSGALGTTVEDRLSSRVATLTSLTEDRSFQDREGFAGEAFALIAKNPVGFGFGSSGAAARSSSGDANGISDFDSGWLNLPYTLGWLGTALYLGGLFRLIGGSGGGLIRLLPVTVGLLFSNILVATTGVATLMFCLLPFVPSGELASRLTPSRAADRRQ